MQGINLQKLCTGRHLVPCHKPYVDVRWRALEKRPRSLCAVNVQLPASLDQALSARRVNKLQIRALCEQQQQEADAALKLQQAQAEAALRQAEDALKLQKKDADIQQKDADMELMRTDTMLTSMTLKHLFARGLLNVTGVLEWLEEEYGPKYGLQLNQKTEIWKAILSDPVNKKLVACLERATSKRKEGTELHSAVREPYDHASNHVHGKKSPDDHTRTSTVVDIVEGPLLPAQAQIMVCICKYFKFPYELHQIQEKLT